MLEKEKLANGDEVWRTERCEARVHVPATSVVVLTIKGHSTMELFPLFVGEPIRRMKRGIRIDWFGDYSEMTGYDSETRVAIREGERVMRCAELRHQLDARPIPFERACAVAEHCRHAALAIVRDRELRVIADESEILGACRFQLAGLH